MEAATAASPQKRLHQLTFNDEPIKKLMARYQALVADNKLASDDSVTFKFKKAEMTSAQTARLMKYLPETYQKILKQDDMRVCLAGEFAAFFLGLLSHYSCINVYTQSQYLVSTHALTAAGAAKLSTTPLMSNNKDIPDPKVRVILNKGCFLQYDEDVDDYTIVPDHMVIDAEEWITEENDAYARAIVTQQNIYCCRAAIYYFHGKFYSLIVDEPPHIVDKTIPIRQLQVYSKIDANPEGRRIIRKELCDRYRYNIFQLDKVNVEKLRAEVPALFMQILQESEFRTCLAGGYAAHLLGMTDRHGDFDLFTNSHFVTKLVTGGTHAADIHIVDRRRGSDGGYSNEPAPSHKNQQLIVETVGYNNLRSPNAIADNLEYAKLLLLTFDLFCCRAAIYYMNGNFWAIKTIEEPNTDNCILMVERSRDANASDHAKIIVGNIKKGRLEKYCKRVLNPQGRSFLDKELKKINDGTVTKGVTVYHH